MKIRKTAKKVMMAGVSFLAFGFMTTVDAHAATCVNSAGQTIGDGNCSGPQPPPIINIISCTPNPPPGGGGSGCCFTADTKVRMADGSIKLIEDILPGEVILSEAVDMELATKITVGGHLFGSLHGKSQQIVNQTSNVMLGNRKLISINGSDYFATEDHTFRSVDGWVSHNPDMTVQNYPDVLEHIGQKPQKLEEGVILMTEQGEVEITELKTKSADPTTLLYDLKVDMTHTLYANGFLAHNAGHNGQTCFFGETQILMQDGTSKLIKDVNPGDVTAGGIVRHKYARHYDYARLFLDENFTYLYDGIYVTALHVVLHDNEWLRMSDSGLGKPVSPPNDSEMVYNLVTDDGIIYVVGDSKTHTFADDRNNFDSIVEKTMMDKEQSQTA